MLTDQSILVESNVEKKEEETYLDSIHIPTDLLPKPVIIKSLGPIMPEELSKIKIDTIINRDFTNACIVSMVNNGLDGKHTILSKDWVEKGSLEKSSHVVINKNKLTI